MLSFPRMEPSWSAGAPHSVKRWQLAGTDYQSAAGDCSLRSGKQFSSWTPLGHKEANQQVKDEDSGFVFKLAVKKSGYMKNSTKFY